MIGIGRVNTIILEDIPLKFIAGMDVTNKKSIRDTVVTKLNGNKIPRNINIVGIEESNSTVSISGALSRPMACTIWKE